MIRPFQNSDLPGIFEVWIRHWKAARQTPPVSVSILERAILSRNFFRPEFLQVALADGQVIAWAHSFLNETSEKQSPQQLAFGDGTSDVTGAKSATIAAFCFADEPGLAICDQLLKAVETNLLAAGITRIDVGLVRDDRHGYAGLAPIGHGIGVPVSDARTGSLLSRRGYHVARSIDRMVVQTSMYRPPVNRAFLQFRRSTRLGYVPVLPSNERIAAAMSHFDLERHVLVDHQQQQTLAMCGLWMGDSEVQVMESSRAILALSLLDAHCYDGQPAQVAGSIFSESTSKELTTECQYLISSLVQSLSNRQIFTVETAVDRDDQKLIEQLIQLKFASVEQGKQWTKTLA
jgi:hypothetical protein